MAENEEAEVEAEKKLSQVAEMALLQEEEARVTPEAVEVASLRVEATFSRRSAEGVEYSMLSGTRRRPSRRPHMWQ